MRQQGGKWGHSPDCQLGGFFGQVSAMLVEHEGSPFVNVSQLRGFALCQPCFNPCPQVQPYLSSMAGTVMACNSQTRQLRPRRGKQLVQGRARLVTGPWRPGGFKESWTHSVSSLYHQCKGKALSSLQGCQVLSPPFS